jgi:DNA mismatch repair protein MutL
MPILILTEQTIGKIAAGEVIERPASIVKELLENSLDSGATQVSIAIREGGLREIRVVDNGCGIAAGDLPLAIHPHATSKLREFDDLLHVATLGFRGEALASIAAVSRLQIRSAEPGSSAASLATDFGADPEIRPASGAAGTTVTVSDLFENVPARRKFLRQPTTEATAIQRAVSAYAASRPDVAFQLEIDGRLSFATDGGGGLRSAATAVFGQEVGHALLELPELDETAIVPGVKSTGWVTGPAVTRSHRQQMHCFVNGRLIQHRTLNFVIEECFHTLLMVGRHPVVMVRIEVDPELVDVNVHPTKAEVRFADERSVCRAVQRSVHAALAGAPTDELPRVSFSIPVAVPAAAVQPTLMPSPAMSADRRDEDDAYTSPPTAARSVPMLRVLGQVGSSYIIAEGPEGLYLIDQHAAHERVMYEKIRSHLVSQSSDQQPLLDPTVIELDPHEAAVMDRSLAELNQIGFEIEPFGPQAFTLRAIPAVMAGVDIRERMHLILRELADGGVGESWLDSVAISAACHTSIRAGQVLSIAEMRELVNQLEQTEHPRACGHGRPTMLLMSQVDLEKQFSRR